MLNGCNLLAGAEFVVAIDGKGLWPNLTPLPGGEIVAAVYNHPSHGMGSGSDVELWVSGDGGWNWTFRSRVSDHTHEPNSIRMNHAVGLNAAGELVALVSGYHEGQRRPFLPLQRCISSDGGRTWERVLLDNPCVPFGDIVRLADGRLACPAYEVLSQAPKRCSWILLSADGGRTWPDRVPVAEHVSETSLLVCRSGTWLAACRTACPDTMDDALPHGSGELLFRSTDAGRTWDAGKLVSPQGQENGHLLELRDGRILLSLTSRIPGLFGVVLRLSDNEGQTWSKPVVLLSAPFSDWRKTDCGYPSSVELEDGTIVTAYYYGPRESAPARYGLPWHQRYHMGVARWRLSCLPA